MSLKNRCLALILILTSAWVHENQARAYVIELPSGLCPFEQEFSLLGPRYANEIRQQIDDGRLVSWGFQADSPLSNTAAVVPMTSQPEARAALCSGVDVCYRFMSLQL